MTVTASPTHTAQDGISRLHVIVNPSPVDDCVALVCSVLGAGARWIQVRVKGESDLRRLTLTAPIAHLCRAHDAVCVVNDRLDVALAIDGDGVHLGQDDLPVPTARRLLGPSAIVGGTARDAETARRLEGEGASYVGVGPIYPTSTKTGLPDPLGPSLIETVAASVSIPVIAIAGVTVATVPELLSAGAHGVAVVGAIAGSADPSAATRELLDALGESP